MSTDDEIEWSTPIPRPEPIHIEVCNRCEISWKLHVSQAMMRHSDEFFYLSEEERPPFHESYISIIDCVTLLKIRNRGPMGPTNPLGSPA